MKYHQLINRIKKLAGAREDESQDALELVVENVAANLSDWTRKGFAAELPEELQSAAQMVPTITHIDEDIIEQLMDLEDIDENRARAYLKAAWQTLTELFDPESVEDITSELPKKMVAQLQ